MDFCVSSPFAGSFEAAFSGLVKITSIDVSSTKVNCERALELLPRMPWAAQLQELGLASTNAVGKEGIRSYSSRDFSLNVLQVRPRSYIVKNI